VKVVPRRVLGMSTRTDMPATTSLTKRERDVADAVAAGLSNKEAASALFLSQRTVEFHLTSIYRKLGVRSRTQLALLRIAGTRSD
jgi:DNA-binding NarL/FixJ family response regulator